VTAPIVDPPQLGAEPPDGRRSPLHRLIPRRESIPTFLVLGAAFLPLALAPVRARFLGPEGRGEFAFFQAAVMVITAAAGGGIRHAYYGQSLKGERRAQLWTWRLWLPSILLALLGAVPLAVAGFISVNPVVGAAVVVVAFGAPLFALVQLEMADAQYHQRQFRVAGLTSVPAVVEFVANIALIVVRALTLTSAVVVTVVSEAARGICAVDFARHDAARTTRLPKDPVASRALARRAIHYLPATLVPLVAANIDAIVYGAMGHTAVLGVYSVAKLVPTFLLLAASISEGRFIARAGRDGIGRASVSLMLPLLGLGVLAAAGGSVLVVPLFGEPFAGARPAFVVTALVGVGGALYVWLVAICARRGLSRVSMRSSAVVLAVGATGAVLLGMSPDLSPVVMGTPVLAGYVLGIAAILVQLRARRA
jgi:O-antigen/teichoic acid export membrane protein